MTGPSTPGPENGAEAEMPTGTAEAGERHPSRAPLNGTAMTRRVTYTATLMLLLILSSCSVKEDRDVCPCWLQIDLSTCSHYTDLVSLKGWTGERAVFGVHIPGEDFTQVHEEEVPRGMVSYCAHSLPGSYGLSGMTVVVPEGEQSPRLYAYRADVPAYGETASDRVSLHKQYAAVAVKMENAADGLEVTVRGRWNGLDLVTLSPVGGAFSFAPERTEDGVWYFRLMRQGDDSLVMDITGGYGRTVPYDLGGTIRAAGYDWGSEDLDDIFLGVDYVTGEVSVSVVPWEEGLVYDGVL